MREDSIFIMNVELLRSRQKILPKTHLSCLFFMYVRFGEENKKTEIHLMPH